MKYKKNDVICFTGPREYEVLSVHPTGYLVTERLLANGGQKVSPVHYFTNEFIEKMIRSKDIIPERKK